MKFILLKSNNSPSEAEYDSNLNFMRKYWKYHKAVVKTSALVVIMPWSELGYTKFIIVVANMHPLTHKLKNLI